MDGIEIRSKDIKLEAIDEIAPNPKNRNKHSEEQIERLVEIIKYQGFRQPLVVSNQSGLLVAGHGRLLAAKKLGLQRVPVIYQDFDSPEQEYAAQVSDNSIASWAELDLSGINADLPDLGPDFELDMLAIKNFVLDPTDRLVAEVNKGDENSAWVGMPEFEKPDKEIRITMIFNTELERELYVKEHSLHVDNRNSGQWTIRM